MTYRLRAGDLHATVSAIGATLLSLDDGGRSLVLPVLGSVPTDDYRGAVLTPWPNRIAAGTYSFDDTDYRLPINDTAGHSALHGLAYNLTWSVEAATLDYAAFTVDLAPSPGYPFALALTMTYRLGVDGLAVSLVASNSGASPAPYGCGFHPYLVAGPGYVDDWTLDLDTVPALPSVLRGHRIDDPYRVVADHGVAAVIAPDGRGVTMAWDAATLPWVQVYTCESADRDVRRTGLAIEPMTCPPQAFRTGTDLVRLAPGATHRADWIIAPWPPGQQT